MTKIAVLSDIHGNTTALEAVLADAKKAKVDEYWILGDILMPGTGRRRILNLLAALPITAIVLGNWENSLWRGLHRKLDLTKASHRYLLRQCQYILEEISPEEIEDLHNQPMQVHRQFGDLTVGITHHLPDKNWGRELIHTGKQEDFDRLVTNPHASIAVYGHIHQQLLRYGSDGQLILNPGSIGQPFFLDAGLRKDLRAQYMILEFDEAGLADVDFRRVDYDVATELQLAKDLNLPYFQVYYESLVNGIHHTHNQELLYEIAQKQGHDIELDEWLDSSND
ncbi:MULTISPECIES: metallophosphoesterase family protein [Streptococcus]|uniref:metallophosphoesterase family protein n=1 Tax=Streptococcus TaxID=1301 RepID=UPI000277F609|nr:MULTISPECIES: metallophosphoesterase family protein [Streptococcus]EJO20702.1 calcineurin-like phosphoesterase family protein [Streptococcus sp. BS35b]ETS89853.1 calcineurin-like phosphoesterase family protein [Streptococcus sp. BS29a]EUB27875.1 calcineurin-like phosphoesterase family protein [Streptococcus sp. BS21]MCY7104341.1 metallophosphoesterase family protein [Streptococcus oralis]